ncbi:glycosyltransferase family 2 protein [Patescibacteria group bacterium]|nr:glycosyltransferase family 2 protein [Patescibacteria group bacterium]MBU1868183.1 glycosyltransferase family 2 protein [Patescibacteria group bacterium]
MLSIGIATLNDESGDLKECLKSILFVDQGIPFEVIVVDDGSTDGIGGFIRNHYPQIKLLVNKENMGLAFSINRAFEASSGGYFFRLDADTVVKPGALKKLVEFLEAHPHVGVVGPKLLSAEGKFQQSAFMKWPTPWVVFNEFNFVVNKLWNRDHPYFRDDPYYSPQPRRVGHITGAAMMMRRTAIDNAGIMDPQIALFRDETDWLYRITQSGWEVWYLPEAEVIHKGGHTAGKKYVFAKDRNLRSFWRFNRKHFPGFVNQFKFWLAVMMGSLISFTLGIILFIPCLPIKRYREISLRIIGNFYFVLVWNLKNFKKILSLNQM